MMTIEMTSMKVENLVIVLQMIYGDIIQISQDLFDSRQ